jgi:hypothetical protein
MMFFYFSLLLVCLLHKWILYFMFTILMYIPSLSAIYVNQVIILFSLRNLFAQVNCDIGTTQQQFQVWTFCSYMTTAHHHHNSRVPTQYDVKHDELRELREKLVLYICKVKQNELASRDEIFLLVAKCHSWWILGQVGIDLKACLTSISWIPCGIACTCSCTYVGWNRPTQRRADL